MTGFPARDLHTSCYKTLWGHDIGDYDFWDIEYAANFYFGEVEQLDICYCLFVVISYRSLHNRQLVSPVADSIPRKPLARYQEKEKSPLHISPSFLHFTFREVF